MSKRFSERINVNMHFYCPDLECFGTITNISDNGMYLSSKNINFPLLSNFRIHVPLHKKEIGVDVRVIRLCKANGYYDGIGVELLSPSQHYITFIKELRRSQKFLSKLNIIVSSN